MDASSFFGYLTIVSASIAYIFSFIVFLISIVIFLEKRNPSQTIAWLLILLVFPVIGFVVYFLFGRNFRKRRMFKKMADDQTAITWDQLIENQKNRVRQKVLFSSDQYGSEQYKLIKLLLNNSQTPFTWNNSSEILTNGEAAFAAKFAAMENAQHHIHLEYFIVKDDNLGKRVKEILIRKATEGVKVRFLYDGLGGWRLGKQYINDLRAAGVAIEPFLPIKIPFLNSELNHRNHRKILIVDGKIGFIGGLNIGDEYVNKNPKYPFWRDTHIRISGEAVYIIQNVFLKNWYFITREMPEGSDYFPKLGKQGHELIQIVPSGPDFDWEAIQQAYFSIITSAKEKIYITTPYLVPDDSILMALKTAALSGLDVRIIVPGIPDKRFVYWATCSYFEELLLAGVRVYKYQKGFIHSKIVTVDSAVASVGTANFDNRSFQYNFEINAFCFKRQTVKKLDEDFQNDLIGSEEIILNEVQRRPLRARFVESSARLVSPLL